MTKKTYSTEVLLRSNTYRQIYHLFEYPANNAGILLSGEMDLSYPDEAGTCQLKEIQEKIAEHLQGVDSVEEVEAEYVRLFDYRPVCAPYENIYRRDFLVHDLVAALASLYRQSGAVCDEKKAPDHISVEFEFMHYLCYQEAAASSGEEGVWRERQQLFLQDHLLRWVPSFTDKLLQNAASPYCLLGELVKALMEMESLYLAGHQGDPS